MGNHAVPQILPPVQKQVDQDTPNGSSKPLRVSQGEKKRYPQEGTKGKLANRHLFPLLGDNPPHEPSTPEQLLCKGYQQHQTCGSHKDEQPPYRRIPDLLKGIERHPCIRKQPSREQPVKGLLHAKAVQVYPQDYAYETEHHTGNDSCMGPYRSCSDHEIDGNRACNQYAYGIKQGIAGLRRNRNGLGQQEIQDKWRGPDEDRREVQRTSTIMTIVHNDRSQLELLSDPYLTNGHKHYLAIKRHLGPSYNCAPKT